MGTTAEKLNKILQTKEAIRTAINNKGGTLTTTDKFSDYATAIDNIQSGGGKSTIYKTLKAMGANWAKAFHVYSSSELNLFYYMTELSESDLPPSNNVANMASMFHGCSKLTSIPQLDTSSCTNTNNMFRDCSSLTTIPQLDTSKAKNMGIMFYNCIVLKKIDITKLANGSSYTNSFAENCYSLTKLIIRNMPSIPAINKNAFNNCYHFTGTTNATYNPQGLKDGRIYVPDDKVDALKTATNWSVYADIIVPLSTLVE